MDNSKISQTELKYNCDAGEASVNIYTGRLLFEHPDISIGINSYQIGISHIYNSQLELPSNLKSYMGKGFKLNIQQYVFLENDKYIYIDGAGYRHTFIPQLGNRYYDTTGLGLTLVVNLANYEIIDQQGNKLIFENNKLVRTISCENISIIKHYDYNEEGKLSSVYDARKPQSKILFEYNDLSGLLKTIICKKNTAILKTIHYNYDANNYLIKITQNMHNVLFKYSNNKMNYAVGLPSKSALKFNYNSSNKITLVSAGVANINSSRIDVSNFCGDDLIVGEDLYCGDTETQLNYTISGGVSDLGTNKISHNNFVYNVKKTIVTNEQAVKMVYYLNDAGNTVSVLEAHNGNINDLRTLERKSCVSMIQSGDFEESINTQYAHQWNTDEPISTTNIMLPTLEDMQNYRKYKCANYIHYTCSFWLKLCNSMVNSKIEITINSGKGSHQVNEQSIATFDKSAVNSWQLIVIPIKIPEDKLNSISIQFLENDELKSVLIADMRLCYDPLTRYCLTDGINYDPLDDIVRIKYTPISQYTEVQKDIDDDFYITGQDLQTTYLSRFKSRGLAPQGDSFILSSCNNTKNMVVKSVKLCTDTEEYPLEFGTDSYGIGTRARFFIETKSPDGDFFTRNFIHFLKNKDIGNKAVDCICQITEANKTVDGNNIQSHVKTYVDLKGKILLEQDEYDVQTLYEYDPYGILSKKTIMHDDTSEELSHTATTNAYNTMEKDYKSDIRTYYDDYFGYVDKVEYKGKVGNPYNAPTLTTTLGYNTYTEKLMSVGNNLNQKNYMSYDSNGRLLELTPTAGDNSAMYGFRFGYNTLGDLQNFHLTYKEGNENKADLLFTKNYNQANKTVTTEQYRDQNPDISTVTFDKYGRPLSIVEDGKTTTFNRQNLWESESVCEITKTYDPFEDKTYLYNYDNFNNVTGYEVRNGNGDNGPLFMTVKAEKDNEVRFTGPHSTYRRLKTEYQENKLLKPRIEKTIDSLPYPNPEAPYNICWNIFGDTNYYYDNLGRIIEKQIIAPQSVKKTYTYKPNTLLKQNIKLKTTQYNQNFTEYNFDIEYDERGNIKTNSMAISGLTTGAKLSSYTYDIANRLKTEERTGRGKVTYTYNQDGSISTEDMAREITNYYYEKGRLWRRKEKFADQYFAYDNLGNCTHYNRNSNSSEPNMVWERGSLLKEYTNANAIYSYNNQGLRFKKEIINGETTTYYYDGAKLLGEKRGLIKIGYIYDADEIIGFCTHGSSKNPYFYVKDAIGNVIAIVRGDDELAHYEYNAWGSCIITKDIDGIATLNPIRWKSHYYDNESGLYYIGGRYYSPIMKSFISACNIDEILYNIDVLGNLNAYSIGNPIHFPVNGFNIFTSMPLVPEASISGNGLPAWLRWSGWTLISGIGRVIGGISAIIAGVTVMIGGAPTGVGIVAGVTMVAGGLSVINGSADIGEYATGYNYMRDGLFNDVLGWSDTAYNIYAIGVDVATIAGSIKTGNYIRNNYIMRGAEVGTKGSQMLNPGDELLRYGGTHGRYLTNPSTPASMVALPPANSGASSVYVVNKAFRVKTATVAAMFGQPGGGTQYFTWRAIYKLIQRGYLIPLP